jgi:hypothetical protein
MNFIFIEKEENFYPASIPPILPDFCFFGMVNNFQAVAIPKAAVANITVELTLEELIFRNQNQKLKFAADIFVCPV